MKKENAKKSGRIKKSAARSDESKVELRERILEVSRELVIQEGFSNLSIRKLGDRIGYAPGTIYLYFKNRDELVREICVRGLADLAERMLPAMEIPDARRRLAALLNAYADFALENPQTYRLSFMENPAFTHEMLRRAPLETEDGAGRKAFNRVVETLQELKREQRLDRADDEHLLAEILWTAVHGIVSLKLIYPAFPINSVETLINKLIEKCLGSTSQ